MKMPSVHAIVAALALSVVCLAPTGCSKKTEDKAKPPAVAPLLAPGEAARGMEACKTWVKRLCDCAKTKPELQSECDLRKGRPTALDMVLSVIRTDDATRVAKLKARSTAKKLIKSCIEHDNKLSNQCPRAD